MQKDAHLTFIGIVHSSLTDLSDCPKQGYEGAPSAQIEIYPEYARAAQDVKPGDRLVLMTWFHEADRGVLEVHPRHDLNRPLAGVFSTRSPHRPNPIGLHEVVVLEVSELQLVVEPLEALDGTPLIDIKISMLKR